MCFFCLGGFVGGLVTKKIGTRISLIVAGVVACIGFIMTSRLDGASVTMLYISYGVLAGAGIGVAYNVIISTVSTWFPDKKGTCSGAMMMGFGASALVVGNLASALIAGPGWRTAFLVLGVALGVILVITGIVLQKPSADMVLPQPEKKAAQSGEDFEPRDYTTGEMIRRFTFWRAFLCIVFLSAVGNTVISFARDLSLSVGASASLATTLVGVLSVCNGLGRIVVGALFDKLGRKKTMLLANVVAIVAAAVTLASVYAGSVPLCVVGLCATGFSYGAGPTISSALTSAFYGTKYFPVNFSVMNFNLMAASFVATAASKLMTATGGYAAPFILLLVLAVCSLLLDLSIKRP
jgi:OFA family oxalate/formate antiporter-like MFS transporter